MSSTLVVAAGSAGSSWTEPRIDHLKALLAEGRSASQIALALGGVTRNAVIGKIHRLGLAGRRPPSPGGTAAIPPRGQRHRRGPSPAPRPPPPPEGSPSGPAVARPSPPPPRVEAVGRFTDLAALPRGACRWPIGDPKTAGFSLCGDPIAPQPRRPAPYCGLHRDRAYRPAPASRSGVGGARSARRSA